MISGLAQHWPHPFIFRNFDLLAFILNFYTLVPSSICTAVALSSSRKSFFPLAKLEHPSAQMIGL